MDDTGFSLLVVLIACPLGLFLQYYLIKSAVSNGVKDVLRAFAGAGAKKDVEALRSSVAWVTYVALNHVRSTAVATSASPEPQTVDGTPDRARSGSHRFAPPS